MAHQRNRYIQELINKAKSFSPIVGVIGHRQVGKTTVLERLCTAYTTLDIEAELSLAETDPEGFLEKHHKSLQGIDECQYVPKLFPALKEHVRKNKKPGQFLLSGSVRFTSRSAIRESLTGRIVNFELLPFSISEMAHKNLPNTLEKVMTSPRVESVVRSLSPLLQGCEKLTKEYNYYFKHGGLPGICFIQDAKVRTKKISEQLRTILDRDLRLITPTTIAYPQLLEFLRYIAYNQGEIFSFSAAQRETGISAVTQKKLLYALEAIFLIRPLKVIGDLKGTTYFLEDQAEANLLTNDELTLNEQRQHLVYRNLRTQLYYQVGVPFNEFTYRTRGGVNIPYCIERETHRLAIIVLENDKPSASELAHGGSFLKRFENGRVLYLCESKKLVAIDSRSVLAPILLFV